MEEEIRAIDTTVIPNSTPLLRLEVWCTPSSTTLPEEIRSLWIGQGTNVEMELGLSTTRASSTGRSHSDSISGGSSIAVKGEPEFGSAYVNMEIAIDTGASLGSEPLTPNADRHQSRRLLQYLRKGTGTGGGDYAGTGKRRRKRQERQGIVGRAPCELAMSENKRRRTLRRR